MAINFFEKEVKKAQKRFNQTFGKQIVCSLEAREAAIISVCWMGVLSKRIKQTKDKKTITSFTQEFYSSRNVLNNFFNQIESQTKERRGFHEPSAYYSVDKERRRSMYQLQ